MAQDQSKATGETKKIEQPKEKSAAESVSDDVSKSDRRTEKLSEKLASSFPAADSEQTKTADKPSASSTQSLPSRRGAGPARERVAANDDLPSIGGLIYALQQRPSRSPFYFALGASVAWLFMCVGAALFLFNERLSGLSTGTEILRDPAALTLGATMFVPIALFWFLALLIWRAQELRLMASAMTEVAVRLAEPDKMAAQSVASLGQTIRRQVAAMNDAISRALGRAGELEALVHNEVAALERSYSENELRIRGLIEELASERDALANNSERVSETLRGVGAQVTRDITEAGDQASKSLASASSNLANTLTARGGKITEAIGAAGSAVDNKLAERGSQITQQLVTQGDEVTKKLDAAGTNVSASLQEATQKVANVVDVKSNQLMTSLTQIGNQLVKDIPGLLDRLDAEQKRLGSIISGANQNFTALETALAKRTTELHGTLKSYTKELDGTLKTRAEELGGTLRTHAAQIDGTLKTRAEELDGTLKSHTDALASRTDELKTNLAERIKALDTTVQQHAKSIETSVTQQTKSLEGMLGRNTMTMNQVLAEGSDKVKKTTEYMAQQTDQARENLSIQADALKGVSHKLLEQVHSLTQRFETQGQAIVSASQALDSSNSQINSILERRHAEIASLLETVSTKAQSLDKMMRSYSGIIEGSLSQVEERAKQVTASLAQETAAQANMTVAEIERLRQDARLHTEQAVAELTGGFHSISNEVANQLGTLTSRFGDTTREMRQVAHSAADEIETTRTELQRRMQGLPEATRHSQEAVRKAISDQLKALGTLSALSAGAGAANGAQQRQVAEYPPQPPSGHQRQQLPSAFGAGQQQSSSELSSVTANLANQLGAAAGAPSSPPPAEQRPTGLGVSLRNAGAGGQEESWSVGDLLARASEPDQGVQPPPAPPPPQPHQYDDGYGAQEYNNGYGTTQGSAGPDLRLTDIASAIDQQTASAVWQRFRRGERDIFTRQLYTLQGQATFDEITGRYQRDPAFRSTVDRYISDFERLLSDAERKGQNAQAINNYLTSETGRVYLMLAHASGRLR